MLFLCMPIQVSSVKASPLATTHFPGHADGVSAAELLQAGEDPSRERRFSFPSAGWSSPCIWISQRSHHHGRTRGLLQSVQKRSRKLRAPTSFAPSRLSTGRISCPNLRNRVQRWWIKHFGKSAFSFLLVRQPVVHATTCGTRFRWRNPKNTVVSGVSRGGGDIL